MNEGEKLVIGIVIVLVIFLLIGMYMYVRWVDWTAVDSLRKKEKFEENLTAVKKKHKKLAMWGNHPKDSRWTTSFSPARHLR